MRLHLKKFFTASGEHHLAMAKAHQLAMDGCEEGDGQHEFHKNSMASHATMGEECLACCKADAIEDLEKTRSEVMPPPKGFTTVTDPPPQYRLIPRAGGPPVPSGINVPDEFKFLTAIEGGE